MKKMRFIVLTSLSLISLAACNQFESFTNFTIDYEQEATIKSSTGISLPFNISTPDMNTNAEQEFQNEDTKKEFINTIFLETLDVEIVTPEGEDFSFLEEISIFIETENHEEMLIASKKPVPPSAGNSISLDCTDEDLQRYIKEDRFSLRLNAVTDELLAQDHVVKIKSSYRVSAKLNN